MYLTDSRHSVPTIRGTYPEVSFPILMNTENLIGRELVEEWKLSGEHVLCAYGQFSNKQKYKKGQVFHSIII